MKINELILMFEEGSSVTRSPKYLKSHMKNLLEVALSDGYFDNTEVDLLKQLAQKYYIPEDELRNILDNSSDVQFEIP